MILVLLRCHAWTAPLETDECNYLYIGQRLAQGAELYLDVWDHQPPGMFVLSSMWVSALGAGEQAYRALGTLASVVCLWFVYRLMRHHAGVAGRWIAVLAFALCSSDPGMAAEGVNRELFMNVLILGAVARIVRPAAPRGWRIASAGLLIGLASLFKTVVVAHWIGIALWLCVGAVHSRRVGSRLFKELGLFAAGPLILWLGTWAYFTAGGRGAAFVDAVFSYNIGYSGVDESVLSRFGSFFQAPEIFGSAFALWVAGGVGLLSLPWRRFRSFSFGVSAMAVSSYLAVCLPGRFWPHYYALMLPWLCVGAGTLADRMVTLRLPKWSPWGYGVVLIGLLVTTEASHYLLLQPDEISYFRYGERMAWARDQAQRVREVTEPHDSVYVYGSDVGIYYYAQRRCATRFTMIEAVSAERAGVARRREQFLADFERNPPRIVLVTEEPFPDLVSVLRQRYRPAGMDEGRMQVLVDRERPIETVDWSWTSP